MLSYRHGFHAGNHADVLKHVLWLQLLRQMTQKDKPLWVLDTHAGAGTYALDSRFAARNREYADGIGRLWARTDLPELLRDYVAQVRAGNPDGGLRIYPGSPQIALQVLRPQDRLRLWELHSTEQQALAEHFAAAGRRVQVNRGDGYAGLKSALPPPSRRGLVLLDPSYETRDDYAAVVAAVTDGLQRFATGTYAVWYPQLQRRESERLPETLTRLAGNDWLHATLQVRAPQDDGFGLHGSGMFVFNPPWKLDVALRAVLPVLARALALDESAGFTLHARQT
ncbi:MAG: 23S rRNA (adenine(2030)-N(6))-methyltransferase RlmJ [Betaproteobacteria bacterium]|nr:23S rRNA (adenine(2030)-N(6))-methyltransferase RlmJ [Betaproteobacteria bacterium]